MRSILFVLVIAGVMIAGIFARGYFRSEATQAPRMSLDMITDGTGYTPSSDLNPTPPDGLPDPGSNVMNVGPVENCISDALPGQNHVFHVVLKDVEDLSGWQTRLKWDAAKLDVQLASFFPFADAGKGAQQISLLNLPIDRRTLTHRSDFILQPLVGDPGNRAAAAVILGDTDSPVLADTPYIGDEQVQTYDAPTGGVIAAFTAQVLTNQTGLLRIDLSADGPGSGISYGPQGPTSSSATRDLTEDELDDGFIAVGVPCPAPGVSCSSPASPPPATPTPLLPPVLTPTPTPVPVPKMSLDMVPDGNAYYDPAQGGNCMVVGSVDNCLSTMTDPDNDGRPGDNRQHTHVVHLILKDVQDLTGWRARLNSDSSQIKVQSVNFTPFTDATTNQNISFLNLPIDPNGTHRSLSWQGDYDPDPNSAVFEAAYSGMMTAGISPDTPPKSPTPDDTSYRAPAGGILATITLEVEAGQEGRSLPINFEPQDGSRLATKVEDLQSGGVVPQVFNGYHGEGVACTIP